MSVLQSGLRRLRANILNPWSKPNLQFGELYRMQHNQILRFIEGMAGSPEGYLISQDYRRDFQEASQAIIDNLNREESRYFLDKEKKVRPLILNFEGRPMRFYSIFDTLGYLMTVAGPAPQLADKENYLLPMGQLFCRWSNELARARGNNPPTMGSIVHVPSKRISILSVDIEDEIETTPNLAVSASLPPSQKLRTTVQRDRLEQLEFFGFDVKKYTNQRAPGWAQASGQCFGHCAETDPLIMAKILIDKGNVDTQSIQGIAINMEAAKAANTDVEFETLSALPDGLKDPCINCQFLMQKLSVDPKNFIVSGVEEYEPTAKHIS
ncbi:MAG: hypothetical protein Q9163_000969 [Psora crenata]